MSLYHAHRALDNASNSGTSAELIGHLHAAQVEIKKAIKTAMDTAIMELEEGTQVDLPLEDPGPTHTVTAGGVVLTPEEVAEGPFPTISEADAKKLHRRGRGRPKAEAALPTEAEYEALAAALEAERAAEVERGAEAPDWATAAP